MIQMANWHERDCRRPDVVIIDTMLACKSCGSFYTHEVYEGTANRGELQKEVLGFDETPADLNLTWPSTVHISSPDEVEDVDIRDTLERLGDMLHEHRRKQQGRKSESAVGVSSEPSAVLTDENLAREAGVGGFLVSTTAESPQRKKADESSGPATSPVYKSLIGLDEIRLLRLSPGESAEDLILHGYLETTYLSARPEFTAVSYTWADSEGNRSLTEEIFLGDHWIPLPITRNCAAALRRLRSHETFWVDSVCINQLNTDEKSHQVGLMRDIFSRATSIMIFLGGDNHSPDARLLKRTSESLFYNEHREEIIWDAVRDEIAVRELFDRPYWSRIWVIQEVLLSRKAVVILGKTAVPLQPLLQARLAEPDGHKRKFNVPRWLHLGNVLPVENFHSLSKLLTETSNCLATDHKDMIFALLGLVQGAHLEGLVADYSKSTPQIRVGIAAYFLIRQGQINTLKSATFNAGQKENIIPGSPSWVPAWGHHPRNEPQAILADSIDTWFFDDFSRKSRFWDGGGEMWCYDTLRPETAISMPVGYSKSSKLYLSSAEWHRCFGDQSIPSTLHRLSTV